MAFKYDKLLGRIKEKFGTQDAFAIALGITNNTLSKKLNNKADFKRNEMIKACSLLEISTSDIAEYFFAM